MNRLRIEWTQEQINNYYLGIKYSDYPSVFWEKIQPQISGFTSFIDIGCGPGAFAIKASEAGLDVQAVDLNKKHLKALKIYIDKFNLKEVKIINGEWPDVDIRRSDVSVCGYSLGGKIGTISGIEKILNNTNKLAFFIVPHDNEQTDFMSKDLYKQLKIQPPQFGGSYIDTLEIFDKLNENVTFEIIENDFGMPINNKNDIIKFTEYLCDKLGIPDIELMKDNIEENIIVRNGLLWIPNLRKSAMITWKR